MKFTSFPIVFIEHLDSFSEMFEETLNSRYIIILRFRSQNLLKKHKESVNDEIPT